MGPTWGPPGSCRPQMGPMLASWTLFSGCGSNGTGTPGITHGVCLGTALYRTKRQRLWTLQNRYEWAFSQSNAWQSIGILVSIDNRRSLGVKHSVKEINFSSGNGVFPDGTKPNLNQTNVDFSSTAISDIHSHPQGTISWVQIPKDAISILIYLRIKLSSTQFIAGLHLPGI